MTNNSAQLLSEKLKQKQQEDRQQVEELIQSELTQLTNNFNTQLNDVLSTTLSGIRQGLQSVNTQAQQMNLDHQEKQQEQKGNFKNYMLISGLLNGCLLLGIAAIFFWLNLFHLQKHQQWPAGYQWVQDMDSGQEILVLPNGASARVIQDKQNPDQQFVLIRSNRR